MCSISSSGWRALALLLALGLLLATPTAHAEPLSSARAHLQRGLELYRGGQYAEAIHEFEAGHAALPHPTFLLNLAQAWRKLGDLERARAYYAQFVSETPAGDGARVQAMAAIEKIDVELRARPRPPVAPPEPPAPPPPTAAPAPPPVTTAPPPTVAATAPTVTALAAPRPPSRRAVGFIGLGLSAAGAATIGGAASVLVTAQQLDDQFVHPAVGTVYDPHLLERRDFDRNLAVGLFAAGGVLVAVGTVLAVRFLPRHGWRRASF